MSWPDVIHTVATYIPGYFHKPVLSFFTGRVLATAISLSLAGIYLPYRLGRAAFRRWKKSRRDERLANLLECKSFVVGSMAEPIFLADVTPDGYKPEDVVCRVTDAYSRDLQSQYPEVYQEAETRWRAAFAGGGLTNNTNLALKDFDITRPGREERHRLSLDLAPILYLDQRITADVWMSGLSNSDRERALASGRQTVNESFSRFFGISLVVLIDGAKPGGPDRVLVMRRSRKMKISPGWYTFGVGETMSEKDLSLGQPDVFEMARRGLKEEIGVTLLGEECHSRIKLIALALDELVYEWQMFGYVDLRTPKRLKSEEKPTWDVSFETIKRGVAQGRAKDRYEHEAMTAVDLTPLEVAKFLQTNPVFHTFKVCIFLVLLVDQRISESELENTFSKYTIPNWKGYQLTTAPTA